MSNTEENILAGDDAYNLYLKGKDKWNKWARDNHGWHVDFSGRTFPGESNFSGFIFPGGVNFSKAQFSGLGEFSEAQFSGEADFSKAQFSKSAYFIGAKFWEEAGFIEAQFSERANFSEVQFSGPGEFREAQFSGEADFNKAQFSGLGEFREAQFSGEANFRIAQFSVGANFSEVQFSKSADFSEVQFSKSADFSKTQFSGETDFIGAQFSEGAYFIGAKFWGTVDFGSTEFLSVAYFLGSKFFDERSAPSFKLAEFRALNIDQTKFNCAPDLRQTTFHQGISMHDTQVSFQTKKESRKPGHASDKEDSERYRRLKDLAITAKDHDREQMFFAYELKSKRYYETTGFKLAPNLLYDWLSDYGRSLTRPVIGLVGVWAIFSAIYYPLLKCTGISPFLFSSSQIAPFLGGSSIFSKAFLKAESLGGWILTFAFVENILGVLFLFLIGLALRNRFKL